MASIDFTYQKQPGRTPLRKPVPLISTKYLGEGKIGAHVSNSEAHEKGDAVLAPAVVYVLSGGENREMTFLSSLKNGVLASCVQVVFHSKKGQGLMPYQMDEIWQKGRKSGKICVDGKTYELSNVDCVFLVTDVDEFESQLVKILSHKSKEDYGRWIISNPCIEIWLYYCYRKELAPELLKLRYVARVHRSQRLKQLNNKLIKGGADPRKAFNNTSVGIINSKEHYRVGHLGIPKFLSTSFHLMMEQILEFINERGRSFEEYQETKRKNIEAFLVGK